MAWKVKKVGKGMYALKQGKKEANLLSTDKKHLQTLADQRNLLSEENRQQYEGG